MITKKWIDPTDACHCIDPWSCPNLHISDYIYKDCGRCADPDWLPGHKGSQRCESGSIASGGTKAHCTCDTCF